MRHHFRRIKKQPRCTNCDDLINEDNGHWVCFTHSEDAWWDEGSIHTSNYVCHDWKREAEK